MPDVPEHVLIYQKLARTIGPAVLKLGLDKAIEEIGIDNIISMLEEYIDALPPEKKVARILSFSGHNFSRTELPEKVRTDPNFRRAVLLGCALYYQHFLRKSRPVKRNSTLKPPEKVGGFLGKILVTDCSDWGDLATTIGGDFMRWLKEWLEERGAPIIFLQHKEVVREVWDETLRNNPDIIFISHLGHGNRYTVTGYDLSVLAKVHAATGEPMYDPALYKGKGSSWLSCEMGRDLLESFIAHGMAEGDGYRNIYYFYWNGRTPYREDPAARSFLWTHLLKTRLMAMGFTAEAAFNAVQEKYQDEAARWADQDPDIASVLLYDMAIHCLLGNKSFVIRELEQVPTKLSFYVTPDAKNYIDKRVITWFIDGKLEAGDGTILSGVDVRIDVGGKRGVARTDELGRFHWEGDKEYPPDDVKEKVICEFEGVTRDHKFYQPSKAEQEVYVPLEREKTWFSNVVLKARWEAPTCVAVEVSGKLHSESGPVPKAEIQIDTWLGDWYFKKALTFTDDNGYFYTKIHMFPAPISWHTWLAWLFGDRVTAELAFRGDWGRKPCSAKVLARLKPIWLPQD